MESRTHHVFRALNRPLTIWGVERRLFFLALTTGVGFFNFFGSLLAGLVAFLALWILAVAAARHDPQMLRILLNSTRLKPRYDGAHFAPERVRMIDHV